VETALGIAFGGLLDEREVRDRGPGLEAEEFCDAKEAEFCSLLSL
jgi:hypothetical protein